MTNVTVSASRFATIDLLRGAAAIAVALFHFSEPYDKQSDLYHRIVSYGWLGVTVFFILSGYCIARTRLNDRITTFWLRRLIRIFIPYWASILLVLATIAVRLITSGYNDVTTLPSNFSGIIYTLLALAAPASNVASINWVYWSLGYELAFYLLAGALIFKRSAALLIPFTLFACTIPSFPFDHWGLFALGVGSFFYTQKNYRIGITTIILGLFHISLRLSSTELTTASITLLLVVFPSKYSLHWISAPLRRASAYSYSLYLIHVPIGCYLLPYYFPYKFDNTSMFPSLLRDVVFLFLCILCSKLFFRFIEQPSHQFARKLKSN